MNKHKYLGNIDVVILVIIVHDTIIIVYTVLGMILVTDNKYKYSRSADSAEFCSAYIILA